MSGLTVTVAWRAWGLGFSVLGPGCMPDMFGWELQAAFGPVFVNWLSRDAR